MMKNKLFIFLNLIFSCYFISSAQEPTTMSLSDLKSMKIEILNSIKFIDRHNSEQAYRGQADAIAITSTKQLWDNLYTTLDPFNQKLNILTDTIFNDFYTKKIKSFDALENYLEYKNCPFMVVCSLFAEQNFNRKDSKKIIKTIYKCFQNIPYFHSRITSTNQLKNFFCEEQWFIVLGNFIYMQKILSKLVEELDKKIEELTTL